MNVAVTGMEAGTGLHYFPKWTEITITLAIIGFGFLVFAVAVKYLPIFSQEAAYEPAAQEMVEASELSHVEL
jgi:Ni/Fe-hydrogenase subunit HybB-like protein